MISFSLYLFDISKVCVFILFFQTFVPLTIKTYFFWLLISSFIVLVFDACAPRSELVLRILVLRAYEQKVVCKYCYLRTLVCSYHFRCLRYYNLRIKTWKIGPFIHLPISLIGHLSSRGQHSTYSALSYQPPLDCLPHLIHFFRHSRT